MFSQKKSFFKEKMFLLLIVGLLVGGYWINKGGEDTPKEETQQGTELSAQRGDIPSRQADNPQPANPSPSKLSIIDSADKSGESNTADGTDKSNAANGAGANQSDGADVPGTDHSDRAEDADSFCDGDRNSAELSRPQDYGQSDSHLSSDSTSANQEAFVKKPYYLVKQDGGMIKIYYCEEAKPNQFIRATEINYSLLRESDQKMFEKGVIRKTKDDLSELLQDFES